MMPRSNAKPLSTFGLLALLSMPAASLADAPGDALDAQTPTQGEVLTPDIAPATPPEPAPVAKPAKFEPRIPGVDQIEDPFLRALLGGVFDVNIRWRYEYADVAGFDESNALTMRTRLGYTTGRYEGLQAAIQIEDNRAADDNWYNAAGLNGEPGKSVIADPEDTELNQFWLDYDFTSLSDNLPVSLRVGRQRIILDDARFVGNVGWRQLEQTFDAARVTAKPVDGLELLYTYLWEVNRIFGPDADRDFDSDSHLVHVAYSKLPVGTVTGFAYLLDLENAGGAALSNQTYGLRLTGERPVNEGLKVGYLASVAWQTDYGDNPTDYGAPYVALEGRLTSADGPFGGLGFELLGSDDGVAVQTPLATGHAFNGYADAFLTTPAGGLRDYYAFAGAKLPGPLKGTGTVWLHQFTGDDTSDDLGWEIDAVATHKFNHYVTGLVKWAYFDGDSGLADIQRVWLQVELAF